MKNKILGVIGSLVLIGGLAITANAAWGPYSWIWPYGAHISQLSVDSGAAFGFNTVPAVVSGTTTLDLSSADSFRVVMGAGNTTVAFSNEMAGQPFHIAIQQDGTGSRTVTWPSNIKWTGGSAPTLTTTANKTDWFSFIADPNGNVYEVAAELNE